jgi:hypothetical protein
VSAMEFASLGLAFLAGLVSIFSPCVLPLLPVVLGTAVSEHRLGPVALAAGLALSFLILGLFVATIGFSLGLDSELFRAIAAVLLLIVGIVLVVPSLQAQLSLATAPLGNWIEQRFGGTAEGPHGSVWCRRPSRRGLDAMRWPDAWRGFGARRSGPRSRSGRARHVYIRHRHCATAARARTCFARGADALAWTNACYRLRRKDRTGSGARIDRHAPPDRPRQAVRGSVASDHSRIAHRDRNSVLA